MTRMQAPTLRRLIFIGFMLVTLPLVGTIVTAIVQVDGFARDSRQALVSVEQNTSMSRALAGRITELERSARQYQALSDTAYKNLYNEHRVEVRSMFDRLTEVDRDSESRAHLQRANRSELAANEVVQAIGSEATAEDLEAAFAALRDDVLAVVQAHSTAARRMGNSMPEQAGVLQRLLMGQAALVIPLSIGLAVLFGVLITRPVRQIDSEIRSLGRGALSEPVKVSGTRDLEELGHRLDWLRVRLLELEAQKAQFLRNVSHELKTPLTNIREGAKLLLDDGGADANDAERRSITRILCNNSIRLQQMIEELLRYGADGDLTPQQMNEMVYLDRLVGGALEELSLTLAARAVTVNASTTPVIAEGNAKRLRVVIDNLLSNAVKYTPCGGDVSVVLKTGDGAITLDVFDSGPGIREQDKAHLFEWFYTGPRPPDAVLEGTGMGLAIAQEYAQQQGGHIRLLESPSGAHFRLTLMESHDE